MKRTLGCLGVLLLSVSLLLFARPAEAAISLTFSAHNWGKTTGTTLTLPSPGSVAVGAGDLAVVVFDDLVGGAAPTIADNLVNTWTPLQAWNGSVRMSAWYSSITNPGSMTVTVTFGSSANARAGVLGIFTGVASASPLDKNPVGTADNASPYIAPLSGVLAQADEVVIGLFGLNGPNADITAATAPDLMVDSFGSVGSGPTTNAKAAMTYRVVSATTSVAPQMTNDTNRAGTVGTATFKAAPVLANFLVEAEAGGAIGTQTAGAPFNIKITARDASNATLTSFTGAGNTVDIISTGTLSAGGGTTTTFTNGVLTWNGVTISNTGSFTLTATKTGGGPSGTSNAFTVNPGALANFLVEAAGGGSIGTQTAGVPFSIKITARDANNNTVTSFTGLGNTVDITSTGTLSAPGGTTATFTNGVLTSTSVTILNTGSFTLTATKTGGGAAGTSNAFTVATASVKVGSFTKTTAVAPATQVVAHGLGEVPKAIIFWTNDLNTENFFVTPWFGFGFTDGTTSLSVAATSADGVATSNASRRIANKALTIVSEGEVLQAEADLQSWDATNFTLNWTTNQSFAGVIHFIAIGGGGVSAKVINWQMPTVLGLFSKNGIGFQPDVVIHANAGGGYGGPVGNTIAGAAFGLGAMDKAGNQWSSGFFTADAVALADTQRGQVTNATLHTITGALGVSKSAAFSSMDADGFTVNFTAVSAATEMASLALKGVNVKAGSFTKSTGAQPASQPITGVGFTPSVVLLSSVQDVPQATPVAHSRFGLGASDGTTQGSSALSDQDAVTPTKVQGIDKTSKVFVKVNNSTPAIDAEANLTSLDSNGFTLNWTTNDAVGTEILYLALGGGAPAVNNFLVEAAGGGPIGPQTAGTPFNIKITARDASNNAVTGFTGTVTITSTGTLSAGGGTTTNFASGVLTWNGVTISNTGTFTITATAGSAGTSNALTVNPTCGSVADASYVAASATSTAATVYWSSANAVLILRESAGSVAGTPVGATTYSAGNTIGTSTVVYSGSVAEKSFLDTGQTAGRTTTDRYKVYVKGAGCYSPGLQVDASPSGTAWSYARSDGPLLKPGIAGAGAIYIGGNGSKITSLSTADGTHSWDPVASTGAIQGWLTWLPVGGDVATGLVGHWKFDEGGGPTAADSSSSGNTGTLNGPTWATGKINGGLSFDGVDDYVDSGTSSSLNLPGAMSAFAWIKFDVVSDEPNGKYFIGQGSPASGDTSQWSLNIGQSAQKVKIIWSGGVRSTSIRDFEIGRWYHIGFTRSGSSGNWSTSLYVDGVLDHTVTGISIDPTATQYPTAIGALGTFGSLRFDGTMDDVRVYNRVLSAAEVSKLYLRGGAWQYRKKITLDYTKVAGALTDFPVLISRTDLDLQAKAQASGNDILFTAADGETKLSHEIEKYDPVTGTLVAWVKVPSLSATANTAVYMYYGDAGASDQQDKTGVWSNGYAGVWHLKESPSGAAGEMKDSTSNANHGTSNGGMTSANQVPGKVGGGLEFDGTNHYIDVGSGASLRPSAAITISAWAYRRDDRVPLATTEQDTFVRSSTSNLGNYVFDFTDAHADGTTELFGNVGAAAGVVSTESADDSPLALNTWHHLAWTYVSGGSSQALYWNGNALTLHHTDTHTIPTLTETVYIGGHPATPGTDVLNGFLDEVRISNVARSAAWITTEYNNQSSPSTFYSVGGEGQVTGATGAQQTVIGGDQSGRVYSMDAAAGFKHWGDTAALTGANAVQAGVSAQVRSWSNSGAGSFQATYTDDVIFAATSNVSTTSNKVFALGASNGAVLWTFQDAVNGVDAIAGQPYVDYARNRIYVVSRAGSGSNQQSLWVIKTVDGELVLKGQAMACPACTNLPATGLKGVHFETSPTLSYDGNTLYIGDTAGKLYAINAGALTLKWTLDLGAGVNIKTSGFVWEDYTTVGRLYFVTADANVRCVQDNGGSGSACAGWTVTNVPGASTPLLLNKLFVGANDGTVRQINLTTGAEDKRFPAAGSLDGTPLGAISTETGNEIFVGTSGGKIFKINLVSGALP